MDQRIEYIIGMYQRIYPDMVVTPETMIKGTSIKKLCETEGGPYQRIRKWCEEKVAKIKPHDQPVVKFSGTKEEHVGGATRDSREGKGRYDLIPPSVLREIALVLEQGAKNHGDNNWKGGIKYSRLIDSSIRHIEQFHDGMRDEKHIIQAICNLIFLAYFELKGRGEELNDLNT